jgi:hypothetical protein
LENPARALERFQRSMLACFIVYARALAPYSRGMFRVPAVQFIDKRLINSMAELFQPTSEQRSDEHFWPNSLRTRLQHNWITASQTRGTTKPDDPLVVPTDFKGTPEQTASAYFSGTPFMNLFLSNAFIDLPATTRFEHQWVVAPTGSGKTQLLQTQILADLEKVKEGASLIIIDSQGMGDGKFLSNVANLKIFAKGQPLDGKLVVLQPDPDHPLALNLFDMGQHSTELSARDRQILHTSALKMITFCLAGTTDQQQDMIEYLVQLAMVIPNATIATVRQMLVVRGLKEFQSEYSEALSIVDETVRDYFLHSFHTQIQNITKEAVLRRIMGMLRNPVFRKMYQNERNRFDMLREIDAGKVIVINTDVALMGEDACELFGRFFISLLVQATQQRTKKTPVFCYIDECQDYIASDENIASLLDKARKQNVGFVLAHQRLANIKSPNVLDALSNVAIKFAGGNVTDAATLARYMRTTPEFVADQPRLSFATFIRGQTPHAIGVKVEYGKLEAMERMTTEEHEELQRSMWERYSVSAQHPLSPDVQGSQSSPEPTESTEKWDDVV